MNDPRTELTDLQLALAVRRRLVWRHQPATWHQTRYLISHDLWHEGMTNGEASDLINRIFDYEFSLCERELDRYLAVLKCVVRPFHHSDHDPHYPASDEQDPYTEEVQP